jgi:hypothetical protein
MGRELRVLWLLVAAVCPGCQTELTGCSIELLYCSSSSMGGEQAALAQGRSQQCDQQLQPFFPLRREQGD